LSLSGQSVLAQQIDEDLVNYAYATTLGTGVYRVGDSTVMVYRMPFSYQLRDVDDESSGLKLLLPVTIGFHDYKVRDILDNEYPEELASIAFVPGLEYHVPLRHNWRLKPYGTLGIGNDTLSDVVTFIYTAGVKSRYVFPQWKNFTFILGNELLYAGYNPRHDERRAYALLSTGLDVERPLGFTMGGRVADMGAYFIYSVYFHDLKFFSRQEDPYRIEQEYEVGFTFGTVHPVEIWVFEFERVGIGYRWGHNYYAVHLVSAFPF